MLLSLPFSSFPTPTKDDRRTTNPWLSLHLLRSIVRSASPFPLAMLSLMVTAKGVGSDKSSPKRIVSLRFGFVMEKYPCSRRSVWPRRWRLGWSPELDSGLLVQPDPSRSWYIIRALASAVSGHVFANVMCVQTGGTMARIDIYILAGQLGNHMVPMRTGRLEE